MVDHREVAIVDVALQAQPAGLRCQHRVEPEREALLDDAADLRVGAVFGRAQPAVRIARAIVASPPALLAGHG